MRRPKSLITPLSILIVGLIIFGGAFEGWNYISSILQPASTNAKNISLNVQPGETSSQIGDNLQAKGVIRSAEAFNVMSRIRGLDTKLQAGVYTKINPSMSISQIIDTLQTGQPDEIQLVIPEGMRLEQIAAIAAASNLPDFNKAQFLAYTKDAKTFPDASKYPLLFNSVPAGSSMEGLLFPDTYDLAPTATALDVIDTMLSEMTTMITQNNLVAEAKQNQMSLYQTLTLASIVEREAGKNDNKSKIASVYWNRLYNDNGSNGQPSQTNGFLDADPTVQYARDTENPPAKYWTPLTDIGDNIAPNSPWNTYKHAGLPPTPICSPGLASLQAAAKPAQTDYLFFYTAANGQTYYASNSTQFASEQALHPVSN
jgi:UPF0755 protein